MAQTVFLPPPIMPMMAQPSSPDPTPLRMLAFSVAEAALSSNPNSPMFDFAGKNRLPTPPAVFPGDTTDRWDEVQGGWTRSGKSGEKSIAERRGRAVWNVLERAKERKLNIVGNVSLPPSPPISPASYNFVLPANSSLAAAIARGQTVPSVNHPERAKVPTLAISMKQNIQLYTRSAEPSPTKSTFSGLDQTRPPPEFVPRLSADEFGQQSRRVSAGAAASRERRRSSFEPLSAAVIDDAIADAPVRQTRRSRLPSLQQIQAKMSGGDKTLRRSGSVDNLPAIRRANANVLRTGSDESLEILVTPVEEKPNPLRERRLALRTIMNKRPSTPPSPVATKEASLLPFLRQRTSGRLASTVKAPPTTEVSRPIDMVTPDRQAKLNRPILKVTPPSFETRPAVPPLRLGHAANSDISPTKSTFSRLPMVVSSGRTTPTESRFNHPAIVRLSTPPPGSTSARPGSPTSPTGSIRSVRSNSTTANGSPTMSMPIITCTPAPATIVRDGIEQDSDDGSDASGDVIVFDGEAEEREREQREKRGMEMRMKLGLRRRSID